MKFGIQIPARAEIWFEISVSSVPLANSAMMSIRRGRGLSTGSHMPKLRNEVAGISYGCRIGLA